MRLEKQFLKYTLKAFMLLAGIFFPILYLSDFLFSESFMALYALIKLPLRYGQSIATLLLWSVWIAVRGMRKRYTDTSFITMGFRPKDGWKFILITSASFAFLDAMILIPSNHLFFGEKVIKTNWSIQKNKQIQGDKLFYLSTFNNKAQFWSVYPNSHFYEGVLKDNNANFDMQGKKIIIPIQEQDFFALWNEPKKLSWQGLKRYEKYLHHHELDSYDTKVQWHIFASRVVLLLPMVLCGFALGWKSGVITMILCSVFSNWLNQIVIFMPLSAAITCVWMNVLLWMGVGLCFI